MLTLYHAPFSPCAQKVRLVLEEKGVSYEGVVINLMFKENLKPEYLAINPNGVVPTLVEDGTSILESSIICEYLEDRFPDHPLRPSDPIAQSKMRLWAKRVDDKIHPLSGVLLFSVFVRPAFANQTPEQRAEMLAKMPDPARRERQADLLENGLESARLPPAVKAMTEMVDDIEATVSQTPWMLGDEMSLTDFALTPYVSILEMFNLKKVFTERPALADWFERIKQTNGYKQGIAAFEAPSIRAHQEKMLIPVTPKLEAMF